MHTVIIGCPGMCVCSIVVTYHCDCFEILFTLLPWIFMVAAACCW